jgi:hypothetical protein
MTYDDLENAFLFVSSGAPFEHHAVIHRITGESFFNSEITGENEIPEEVDECDDYLAVPHKNELDLGRPLVMEFVRTCCPEHGARVQGIFSRQGAYRRYKDFLADKGLLESWYDFENQRTREALLQWCEEKGIILDKDERTSL